jgi:hypothetical protein
MSPCARPFIDLGEIDGSRTQLFEYFITEAYKDIEKNQKVLAPKAATRRYEEAKVALEAALRDVGVEPSQIPPGGVSGPGGKA